MSTAFSVLAQSHMDSGCCRCSWSYIYHPPPPEHHDCHPHLWPRKFSSGALGFWMYLLLSVRERSEASASWVCHLVVVALKMYLQVTLKTVNMFHEDINICLSLKSWKNLVCWNITWFCTVEIVATVLHEGMATFSGSVIKSLMSKCDFISCMKANEWLS